MAGSSCHTGADRLLLHAPSGSTAGLNFDMRVVLWFSRLVSHHLNGLSDGMMANPLLQGGGPQKDGGVPEEGEAHPLLGELLPCPARMIRPV